METSETIVADPTCRLGNLLHVSSGDNVLASASWGLTEGLATSQATTLRNLCSAVTPAARMWFKRKLGVPSSFGQSEGSTCWQVRMNARAMAPWRMGGSMTGRRRIDTQSGNDLPKKTPRTIPASGFYATWSPHLDFLEIITTSSFSNERDTLKK